MFNRDKFRGKVFEKGKTLSKVASYLGVNPATLTRKMSGESDFTRSEIQQISCFLNLSDEEVGSIFLRNNLRFRKYDETFIFFAITCENARSGLGFFEGEVESGYLTKQ